MKIQVGGGALKELPIRVVKQISIPTSLYFFPGQYEILVAKYKKMK